MKRLVSIILTLAMLLLITPASFTNNSIESIFELASESVSEFCEERMMQIEEQLQFLEEYREYYNEFMETWEEQEEMNSFAAEYIVFSERLERKVSACPAVF